MSAKPGVLAIWNDCAPDAQREYEHWYRSEHLAERVDLPGFRAGWRYVAVSGEPRYFTHYETESAAVLFSEVYLARMNDPTPLTRSIMSGPFRNATRTVCSRALRIGDARGAFATVLRFEEPPDAGAAAGALRALAADEDVLRAELWIAEEVPEGIASAEQALRGPDATIAACALLESAEEATATALAAAAAAALPGASRVGVYRLMLSLHRADRG